MAFRERQIELLLIGDRQNTDRPSAMFSKSENTKTPDCCPLGSRNVRSKPFSQHSLRMRLAVGAGTSAWATKWDELNTG